MSEYNLLWFKDTLWVIDVSQAVELDHPMALDFLRRDCQIMNEFFAKKGIQTLSLQDTYEFVVDQDSVPTQKEEVEEYIKELFKTRDTCEQQTAEEEHKDNIFRQQYIPRTVQELSLDEIYRMEREGQSVTDYAKMATFQATGAGQDEDTQSVVTESDLQSQTREAMDELSSGSSSSSDDEHQVTDDIVKIREKTISEMTKEEKKEHKRRVKEMNREKRKTKTPKHIKKRAEQKNKK